MMGKENQPHIKQYQAEAQNESTHKQKDIAVIGIACRFPGANNYEEFWENLIQGRSSIEEIPKERWDWKTYWGDPQTEANKSNSRWGGFIKNVDTFDASFFGFSPRELETMDPQQRIMLELSWECFEDAGICPSHVSGKKVGAYVGVIGSDYKELQERKFRTIEMYHSTGTAMSVIANHISHCFNLKGPSFPIDAACSGSLIAIHLAIQSLQLGECSMALVGGVNLLLSPTPYISYSKTGMLSPTGSCKTFDESADGYVRGEGAGLILLKPLDKAIEDGDTIHGILKGSAENHSGKTHTLTYPNPDAQADVIMEAQKRARVTPESISYIEAHGTGTPKGDPIEFQGLIKAFTSFTSQEQKSLRDNYCSLGSVKTNIGHLESAAGIAGVIKVLLSLKYKKLPGLQNFKQLNHRISIENSPFYFTNQSQEWKHINDKNDQPFPRRAGVSSFGFGGTNAHVVIEEAATISRHADIKLPYYLICLSAKTEEALQKKEEDLQCWLKKKGHENALSDLSATLLLGREHFEIRSAFVVCDVQELQNKLGQVLENEETEGYFKESDTKTGRLIRPRFEEMGRAIIKELHTDKLVDKQEYSNKLMALAELYVNGYNLDWRMIFLDEKIHRINLPTYPFMRERYWMSDSDDKNYSIVTRSGMQDFIHPLLHQNTSNLFEQKFSSTFTGQEFFVADHIIKGQRILPGVAYLEMAHEAVKLAAKTEVLENDQTGIQLKNVVWSRPIAVENQPIQVHIGLFPQDNGEIAFEIYSQFKDAEPVVHSQGSAVLSSVAEIPALDIVALQAQCFQDISGKQCYEDFNAIGFEYGSGHQGIEQIYMGQDQVLAKLCLPSSILDTKGQFSLHPSLMDAALQASIWLSAGSGDIKPYLPFALQEIEIFGKLNSAMWALVKYSDGSTATNKVQKFDIDLCDGQGTICVRMKGFSMIVLEGELGAAVTPDVLMFQSAWKEQTIAREQAVASFYNQHLVILCEMNEAFRESIETEMNRISRDFRCRVLQTNKEDIAQRFSTYAAQVFEEIQSILKNKPKGTVFIQVLVPMQAEKELFFGISGLLKTAQLENPKLIGQLIGVDPGDDAKEIIKKIKENGKRTIDNEICYKNNKRWVAGWSEIGISQEVMSIPWKDKGIYLITGGAGGLGLIFVKEIVQQSKGTTIILTGRSPLNNEKQVALKELNTLGAHVIYKQVDVAQKDAVIDLVRSIREDFGSINGIIHSAGVIRDNFIIKKEKDELVEVLAPKVIGLVNVDQASKDMPIDFFCFFSSFGGTMGNPGQADYAAANAFMDAYAKYRNNLVASKERHGQTLSISWPLWKDGGMHVDQETEKMMLENIGMAAMQNPTGLRAFYQCLAAGADHVQVIEGDTKRIRAIHTSQQSNKEALTTSSSLAKREAVVTIAEDILREKVINYFKKLLSSTLKLSVHHIEADAPMEKYGIDSIMVIQLNNQLEKTFGSLSKTLFFEYQNIQELTGYFLESYRDQLKELLGIEEEAAVTAETAKDFAIVDESVKSDISLYKRSRFRSHPKDNQEEKGALDIAIIGVAGRYPGARNIQEFWENLQNGKDCITEIPKDRWDYSLYYDEDKNKPGKSYSKWGGFLEGVDQFDPLFFNISPREAETMDPQDRLFLQCAYAALEDSGYTRKAISSKQKISLSGNVGVYVGVMYDEYPLYAAQEQIMGRPTAVFGAPASIANRVSYYCNLHGPSMTVDTMCSSSLTAIHLACQSLQRGECELAIAGGVNVSIHPHKYLLLSQGKFVSSKGRCESFGQGGDGYVPGEGVGAVLLKPLSEAIADGDHIYGIIKGTAVNHGGKTNGYTVPNPNAQAEVIGRATKEARINPRTVSYIEAHGTGTALGDPIEIAGLTKAFQDYTKDKQFCALGSAKSNIGHCESASGIAGLTKILLQLKYCKLVPSLHSKVLNPNIDFINTPFVVQQELEEWKRPMIEIDGEAKEYPRIAGISAFGAGGANAHIVIEEYIAKDQQRPSCMIATQKQEIIVLSAKNTERLQEQACQLLAFIQGQESSELSLADMAYTLQVGREAMEERLGIIVGSFKELKEKLESFVEGQEEIDNLFRGQMRSNKETLAIFAADEELMEAVYKWIQHGKNAKIVDLWVKGLNFNWNKLYSDGDAKPRRISLPTYPFAKERYWIPTTDSKAISTIEASIHPLLHKNTSDLSEQRFSSTFTGQEFFLADHVVKGQRFLPGVAYLEMARAAIDQAAGGLKEGKNGIRLRNVIWVRPIAVGDKPVQVHIGVFPEENREILYEIYSGYNGSEDKTVVYSQGSAMLYSMAEVPHIDLKELQATCCQNRLSSAQCYETYRTMGIDYGLRQQGIEMVYMGSGQVLAKLTLPSAVANTKEQFVLHPSIMDAALQASLGLMMGSGDLNLMLPFALEEIEIVGNCNSALWAWIRYSEQSRTGDKVQKLDIDLCDDDGMVCVRMKGLSLRVLEGEIGLVGSPAALGALMLRPSWREQRIDSEATAPGYDRHLVLLCGFQEVFRESIENQMNRVRCLNLQYGPEGIAERFQACAVQAFEEIKSVLKEKPKGNVLVQIVVSTQDEKQLFAGLSGLLKTSQLENPKIMGQLIEMDTEGAAEGIIEKLKDNSRCPSDCRIRYQEGKRWVLSWSEDALTQEITEIPWNNQGIYLITGGTGDLGLIFAKEIVHKVKGATLILTGRSLLSKAKQAKLQELEAAGAHIAYMQVDVTQREAVIDLIQNIKEEFGDINGVIHSAGLIQDNFILRKNREELQKVLSPKVAGLVNLDEASKNLSLDFFILFSSVTGAAGNPGQADYAMANAFMDAYSSYRNTLVAAKQRHGQTLSINWPLWKDGGMHVDAATEKMMMHSSGMAAMQTSTGIRALYQGVASGRDQVMVIEGNLKKLRDVFLNQLSSRATAETLSSKNNKAMQVLAQDILQEKTEIYFKNLISSAIKLPPHCIEADTPLEQYGIDSIVGMELVNQLEKHFGSLSKMLFFEYQNIQELTSHFLASYQNQLANLLGFAEEAAATTTKDFTIEEEPVKSDVRSHRHSRFISPSTDCLEEKRAMDIAIIGVTGHYPGARNVQELWQILRDGKDCITEVPKDRWNHSLYFDEDKNKPGKTYSKWGGFIDGVDQFDPSFFNISPQELEITAPQERIFLETVWNLFESAGYTRETLQHLYKGKVGVYAGTMWCENPFAIPNRVSNFFDLQGPSIAVATACSSSTIAIHMACESLIRGECRLAVAGGVNLSLHPEKFVDLSYIKLIGSHINSRSFGVGDGYLPAEGAGAVLLKPLSQAIEDQDPILAVIKATGTNHSGHSNGSFTPNPKGQVQLLEDNFVKSEIDPRTISYVEAFALGSALGDSMEVTALNKVFQKYTADQHFCVIGSVKSNIGHAEAASGISQLTKIILQLQHKELVPSIKTMPLNPNINFNNTPFYLQQELQEWKLPVVKINGEEREFPRRATVSSFAAGGANGHLIVEEYIPPQEDTMNIRSTTGPQLVVFSAKNQERLLAVVQQMLDFVETKEFFLPDIAYTLQVGRESMKSRVAMLVHTQDELIQGMKEYLQSINKGKLPETSIPVFSGELEVDLTVGRGPIFDKIGGTVDQVLLEEKNLEKIAIHWTQGCKIPWESLHEVHEVRRIALPTYPFEK
jgi:polyketide synthase PksN